MILAVLLRILLCYTALAGMLLIASYAHSAETSWQLLRETLCTPEGLLAQYEAQTEDSGCHTPYYLDACNRSEAKPRKFCEKSGRIDDIETACTLGNTPHSLIVSAYEAAEQHIRREVFFCYCSDTKSPFCRYSGGDVGNQKACRLVAKPMLLEGQELYSATLLSIPTVDHARTWAISHALATPTEPRQYTWNWITALLWQKVNDSTPCD